MKTRLIQIGNSRGIRLPKTILNEAQLDSEVDLKAEPGCIVILARLDRIKLEQIPGAPAGAVPQTATYFDPAVALSAGR